MFMIMLRMAEGLKEKKGETLKVLKLSNKPFSSLPQSISNMNLKALILNGCTRLKNVPSLANLKGLQLLDLSHTSIEELPLGIEELSGLRHLNLAHTKRLKMFRAGVLSKLSSLTDLSMYESKWVWSTSAALEVGGAGVHEISGLPHLSNLALHLADWPDLVACVAHRNDLKLFHLSVGFWGPTRVRVGNAVVISGCYITARGEGSQVILPSNTQQLVVENCQLSELVVVDLLNLRELKECCIKGCHQMKYLVTVEEFTTQTYLPNLERLELGRLPNLRALYRGVVPKGTLMNLKVLSISHCHNLMHLFSVRSLKQLHNLERICISDCYAMEEMVVEGDGSEFHNTNHSVVVLPRLTTLVLRYLLNLKSVCRRKLHCVALETIEIGNCPKLRKFPLDEIPTLGLKAIHGGKKWWDTLEWDHTCTKTMLEPRLHHLYEEEFEAA